MSNSMDRIDLYLAYLNGESSLLPEPVTQRDKYLYNLCINGGGQGDDYVLTDTDKEEIAALVGGDSIPSYWKDALDTGVAAINTALLNAGRNKSAFLFYSDAHWNYGSQMSPRLLKYLYEHTGMARTFFGGDIVNNEADDYDTMAYLWDWRKQLKGVPNHHSVVGNHDDGNTTNNLFSEQYVYGYLLAAEETPDITRGSSGIYYYVDSPGEKTRYLCLDTAYQGVGSEQQEFVKNALLTTPEGWHIVAVAHIWHDTNYDVSPPVPGDINSNASVLLSMFDSYNSRSGDYANCGGWVEFCIGGHTHWDYDSVSATGIPVILVETDSQHVRSGLGFTAGTTTEASVNGIIADYDNHVIHVVRIGRGESRNIEVTNYVVSYTNVLSTATDTDGNIYNGVGWQADRECSTSSYAERDSSDGYDLTGFLPMTDGDVVYLKNIVMPDGVTDRSNKMYIYESDKVTGVASCSLCPTDTAGGANFNPVFGADGNLCKFSIPSGYSGRYFRLNATQIDDTSIITINEPIA